MKLADVTFIETADAEVAHTAVLAAFGGASGLRSQELLLSALMTPRATWAGVPLYPSLAAMAGAYAFGLTRNHAFVDGNKRTAFVIAFAFLEANGVALTVGSEWIAIMEGLAAGTVSRDEVVAMLVQVMPDEDPVPVEP
jgi:death on curing protein